jgi:hypothetical protein
MPYATVTDLRAEGVPTEIADAQIQPAIDRWSQFIDRACRQFFEAKTLTVDLDGNDSHILFLPFPIISVTSLYLNGQFTTALGTSSYTVYNGRTTGGQDDRKNPKIRLVRASSSIYEVPRLNPHGPVFLKGNRNQRIVGSFGYTESDGSTPLLIKRAVMKLTVKSLKNGAGLWDELENPPVPGGGVMSETTDGHTITYDAFRINPSRPGLSGITGDQEVDRILDLYKAPLAMSVPCSVDSFKG